MTNNKTYRAYYGVIVRADDERNAMIQGFNRLAAFYGGPEDEDDADEEEDKHESDGDEEDEHEDPRDRGRVAFVRADVIDEA
jgi:hypothetical protein